jgi:hypothetical protein
MVHAVHLVNFLLTVTHFQDCYRSMTCICIIHAIFGNNGARILMFCMDVPYPLVYVWLTFTFF